MSLIKFYRLQQNARVTAFTVFELLRKTNSEGRGGGKTIPTEIRVNINISSKVLLEAFRMLFYLLLRRPSYWQNETA